MTLWTTQRPVLSTLLLSAVLMTSMATGVAAQSTGGLDRSILSSGTALNEAQKKSIATFGAPSFETIKTSTDNKALEDARTTLTAPLRDPGSTAAFRKGYGTVLVAELGPVAKGKDLRRALLAMQVIRFARSSEAFDLLVERTSPASEGDAGKRIAAASLLIDGIGEADVPNAYFEGAARRLRDAAAAETDWRALQQKLLAISAVASRKELPAESARNIRRMQAEALSAVAKAIRASTKADTRALAVQRVLIGVRNDMLQMPQADRSAYGKALAPMLGELLAAASAQWTSAHENAELKASYGSLSNACEVLLRLVDRAERPSAYAGSKPDSDARILGPAWDSNEKAKFDAEVKRWTDIVGAAPYKA
jgi:hypothetical protein